MKRTMITTIATAAMLFGATALMAAGDAKAGAAVYTRACKSCHMLDGTPNPAIAKMMKVEMKSLSSAEVQAGSDAELKAVVTAGKGKMRAISTVSGADVDNVVAYVRSLKK